MNDCEKITKFHVDCINSAIKVALEYDSVMGGSRKLGITAEVGEVLASYELGLRLMKNPRTEGFDALDAKDLRVQIKTRRSESEGLPRDAGRLSSFSNHEFDYALLVLLDRKYRICEIWKASYKKLAPIIAKQKRRNPNLSYFKKCSEEIYASGKYRRSR